jgi:hypothetical protein
MDMGMKIMHQHERVESKCNYMFMYIYMYMSRNMFIVQENVHVHVHIFCHIFLKIYWKATYSQKFLFFAKTDIFTSRNSVRFYFLAFWNKQNCHFQFNSTSLLALRSTQQFACSKYTLFARVKQYLRAFPINKGCHIAPTWLKGQGHDFRIG